MQAKDRHNRMARTLGCLVASMTVGAAVLDWVQPSHSASETPAIELIARGSSQQWNAVRIAARPPTGPEAVRDTHFIIDRDGKWDATEAWVKGRHFGRESVVRISLLTSGRSNQVSSNQSLAVQRLVGELQRLYTIDARQIVVDDTLEIPASPSIASAARSHR